MNGIEAVTAERRGQDEAWGPAHDDSHVKGELIAAAMCYLKLAQAQVHSLAGNALADKAIATMMTGVPKDWPWDPMDWHPSIIIKNNLKKAGALSVSEWDRIDRTGL